MLFNSVENRFKFRINVSICIVYGKIAYIIHTKKIDFGAFGASHTGHGLEKLNTSVFCCTTCSFAGGEKGLADPQARVEQQPAVRRAGATARIVSAAVARITGKCGGCLS